MALLAAALVFACGDGTGPETRLDGQLDFLRFPGPPPLETFQVSFWAVHGDDREAVIHYLPLVVGGERREFLEFKVAGDALLRAPDGRRFMPGDSIRITITVSPDGRFLLDMQPSGLEFAPDRPARLRIRYDRLAGDLNGDGRIDDADDLLDVRMGMWKRQRPGDPWTRVGTVRARELKEVEGRITDFTGFCLAG